MPQSSLGQAAAAAPGRHESLQHRDGHRPSPDSEASHRDHCRRRVACGPGPDASAPAESVAAGGPSSGARAAPPRARDQSRRRLSAAGHFRRRTPMMMSKSVPAIHESLTPEVINCRRRRRGASHGPVIIGMPDSDPMIIAGRVSRHESLPATVTHHATPGS